MEKDENYPLVSVIIPLYNMERYIMNCIESVKNQTIENFECIIINDGSTDNSKEIVNKLIESDNRFKILDKPNGGLSSARNVGIESSKGKYISFLDSDDRWKENKLLNQIKIFEKDKSIDLIYSNAEIFNEIQQKYTDYNGPKYNSNPLELLAGNKIIGSGSSVIINKTFLNKVGFFNENLKSFEDLEFWFRCAIKNGKIEFCPNKDVIISKRENSLSRNHSQMISENLKCFRSQLEILNQSNYELKQVLKYSIQRIKYSTQLLPKSYQFPKLKSTFGLLTILISFLLKKSEQ